MKKPKIIHVRIFVIKIMDCKIGQITHLYRKINNKLRDHKCSRLIPLQPNASHYYPITNNQFLKGQVLLWVVSRRSKKHHTRLILHTCMLFKQNPQTRTKTFNTFKIALNHFVVSRKKIHKKNVIYHTTTSKTGR